MAEDSDRTENAELTDYLTKWAANVREGRGHVPPPPGRAADAKSIFEAVQAVGDASRRDQADPRLLRMALEADATAYRPWQERADQAESSGAGASRSRRLLRFRPWLLAAAACVPVMIGVGICQFGGVGPGPSVDAWEAAFNLRVGYSDFGDAARGSGGLRPGTQASIFFTLPEPAHYSLVLLDQSLKLSVEKASQPAPAGRIAVSWTLPAVAGTSADETVFVVAGLRPWDDIAKVVNAINSQLAGSRANRTAEIIAELHRRTQQAVSAVAYTVQNEGT